MRVKCTSRPTALPRQGVQTVPQKDRVIIASPGGGGRAIRASATSLRSSGMCNWLRLCRSRAADTVSPSNLTALSIVRRPRRLRAAAAE